MPRWSVCQGNRGQETKRSLLTIFINNCYFNTGPFRNIQGNKTIFFFTSVGFIIATAM